MGQLAGPLAAQHLGAHFQCPFVVEFRDPIPYPGRPPLPPDRKSLLESCLSRSALILTTTEGIQQKVEEEFPVVRGRVRTFYSCYADDVRPPASGVSKQGNLVLVHAGVLLYVYGGKRRNATTLVQAIGEAARSEPSAQGRINLRLIGAGRGGEEAVAVARELKIPWAVELLPQMPPEACLAEMDRADVLVAIKFDDADYDLQVPGKVFQYLGRGKPILGLMRETEAARILRRSGLGIVVSSSDVAGISAAVIDLWRNRACLPGRFQPDWDYIGQFSLSAMGKRLDRELRDVLGAQRAISMKGASVPPLK